MTHQTTIEQLTEVLELMEPYVDVLDGPDGPRPNSAMEAARIVDEIITSEWLALQNELDRTAPPQVDGDELLSNGILCTGVGPHYPAVAVAVVDAFRFVEAYGWPVSHARAREIADAGKC